MGPGDVVVRTSANSGDERTGTVRIGDQTFLITQASLRCNLQVSPASQVVAAAGETVQITVTVEEGCAWTAKPTATFLTIQGSASRVGAGTLFVAVAPNTAAGRTGTISIGSVLIEIVQPSPFPPPAACAYSVSPTSFKFPAVSTSQQFTVTTGPGCVWTASVSEPPFSIPSGAAGVGTGTITVLSQTNTGGGERFATLQAAGVNVKLSQENCTYSLSPRFITVPEEGGTFSATVTTIPGCPWTVTAPAFVHVSPDAGTGEGTLSLAVDPNTAKIGRSDSISIFSRTGTSIVQAPGADCVLATPDAQIASAGGTGVIKVSALDLCSWSVANVPSFVTITSGGKGVGSGTIAYSVGPNPASTSRVGTMTIRNSSATFFQAPSPPFSSTFFSYSSDPDSDVGAGQSYAFVINDGTFSAWTEGGASGTNFVGIQLRSLPVDGSWDLFFTAPNGGGLVPGTYENAGRYPMPGATVPTLFVAGDGRSCFQPTGRFVVLEANYGAGGTVNRFHATFEQRCGGAAAFYGEIFIVGNPPR
jgi:hypothetical protein